MGEFQWTLQWHPLSHWKTRPGKTTNLLSSFTSMLAKNSVDIFEYQSLHPQPHPTHPSPMFPLTSVTCQLKPIVKGLCVMRLKARHGPVYQKPGPPTPVNDHRRQSGRFTGEGTRPSTPKRTPRRSPRLRSTPRHASAENLPQVKAPCMVFWILFPTRFHERDKNSV